MSLLKVNELVKNTADGFKLNGVSFEIEEKGIYGFFGKKGSGKTLLASLLCGVCDADEGDICYKDKSIYASEKQAVVVKKKIGYVPDAVRFPSDMSVEELLDFTGAAKGVSPDKRARQIKEALTLTGLDKKSEYLIENLSPSEKKRVAYANALLGNPDVIVIDEPIAMIDLLQRDEIKKLIAMLGKMKVVVAFCKNPADIEEMCDYIGIMSNGNLRIFESAAEIAEKLGGNVSALLRIRSKGADVEKIIDVLCNIEHITDVRAGNQSSAIIDIKIECSTRDGVSAAVSSAVEALGVEIVSLRFADLKVADLVEALSAQSEEE